VRLEARPANAEGTGAVSVRDLVRSALRMRPDRIVVGEVRGGEALDMLQACNTGHDGSLSTVHANSPDDALARIETLALCSDVPLPLPAIRQQLVAAIDGIVQVRRGLDGRRVITAVAELGSGGDERTRNLLTRVDGRLVVCSAPDRAARRPEVDLAREWASCAR
jgi:pilus assembly protein CpaF